MFVKPRACRIGQGYLIVLALIMYTHHPYRVLRRWSRLWDEYGKQLLEERFLSHYGRLIFSAFHEPSLCLIGQYNTYVHTRRNNRVAVDREGLREIRLRRIFPG